MSLNVDHNDAYIALEVYKRSLINKINSFDMGQLFRSKVRNLVKDSAEQGERICVLTYDWIKENFNDYDNNSFFD